MPDYTNFILRLFMFAIVHSLLAAPQIKDLICGSRAFIRSIYRALYNLLSLIMFGWAMSAYRHSPVIYFVPGLWSLIMYLSQLLLLIALIRCVQQTDAADFIGIKQLRKHEHVDSLKTDGFYSIVRHPLYLLSILFLLLNPVMTVQWLILTGFSILYFIIGALIEETRLIKAYGDTYKSYRETVPFIIPGRKKRIKS